MTTEVKCVVNLVQYILISIVTKTKTAKKMKPEENTFPSGSS